MVEVVICDCFGRSVRLGRYWVGRLVLIAYMVVCGVVMGY